MNILRLISNSASKALGSTSVRELGTPTMPLPSPEMATKKATFGMS